MRAFRRLLQIQNWQIFDLFVSGPTILCIDRKLCIYLHPGGGWVCLCLCFYIQMFIPVILVVILCVCVGCREGLKLIPT